VTGQHGPAKIGHVVSQNATFTVCIIKPAEGLHTGIKGYE